MSVRIKSKLWIDALLRRVMMQGEFGAVIHKGAEEAGAVYVLVNRVNQTCELLVPAMGASLSAEGEYLFEIWKQEPQSWEDVNTYMARQREFDSDIWLVEIELRSGFANLQLAKNHH